MRIEPPPTLRRMAGETIPFRVTTDATLQTLPRRLPMSEQEEPLGIVEVGRAQRRPRRHSRLNVAGDTELLLVVTVGAGGLPGVGGARVTGQESGRMVA